MQISATEQCLVVDDALTDPQRWVDFAEHEWPSFVLAPRNAYPGVELNLPPPLRARLDDFFRLHIRSRMGMRRTLDVTARMSMVTLQPHELMPIQWLCHRDRLGVPKEQYVAASVLYLFKDAELGGTSFYTPRGSLADTEQLMLEAATEPPAAFAVARGLKPGYLLDSNAYFERTGTVEARWNRMIFYNGSQFHSPDLRAPGKIRADVRSGRLTLNGFFTCRRPII